MKALILAAGYATRLYPLTKDKPKALLTIGHKTILDFVVDEVLKINEIDEIYIVTNSKFHSSFSNWVAEKNSPVNITVIDDGTSSDETKLGAIGDIIYSIQKEKIDDDLLIMASDNIFTFSLTDFYNYFKKVNSDCILVGKVENKEDLKRMANVITNHDGSVKDMVEKPLVPISDIAAYASYFYKKSTLALFNTYIDEGNNPDAPGFFPSWLCKRKKVFAYEFDGKCYDIGTPSSYEEVNKKFSN